MSQYFAPTGLRTLGVQGAGSYGGTTTAYTLATNNSTLMAIGDAVALVGGSVVPISASPAAGTLSANTPIGFVLGFEYTDPNNPGRGLVCSQILAANAISSLGYLNVTVLVNDDPNARFEIQASGSVALTNVGNTIGINGFAPSLPKKSSQMYADISTISATSTTLPLKIVGIAKETDNAAGDAYTKIIARWNQGTHYYQVSGTH